MKKFALAALALAAGASFSVAEAQRPGFGYDPVPPPVYRPGFHTYPERHHGICHQKAHRLHWFERRAAADGRLSWSERREIDALRRDLRRTCGDWRWR